jgi:hypothetical protein
MLTPMTFARHSYGNRPQAVLVTPYRRFADICYGNARAMIQCRYQTYYCSHKNLVNYVICKFVIAVFHISPNLRDFKVCGNETFPFMMY